MATVEGTSRFRHGLTEEGEQADQPAGPLTEQGRRIIFSGGPLAEFGERRIGRHHTGDGADMKALLYGQNPECHDLSGLRPHDRSAQDAATRCCHHLYQAVLPALGPRPVVAGHCGSQHLDRVVGLPRLRFGLPDLGDFRIGEGNPWYSPQVGPGGQAEQRVAEHDTGLVSGKMRELRPARYIADRIDAPIAGPLPCVDDDTGGRAGDRGQVKA